MKLTIDGQSFEADPNDLTNREAILIKKETGLGARDLMRGLDELDMLSWTAFVWVLLKRTEPELKFDDVEFTVGEFGNGIELSDDEARAAIARARQDAETEAEGTKAVAQFLASLPEEQRARLEADPTPAPVG